MGLRVYDLGLRGYTLKLRIQAIGFRVYAVGLGIGIGVKGLGCRFLDPSPSVFSSDKRCGHFTL